MLCQFRAGDTRGTHTRGSAGTYIDQDGRVQSAASGAERITWLDLNGDGIREAYLLMEEARTQAAATPEDFSTWDTFGPPTVTGSKPDPAGGTGAYLLDDNAGSAEYIKSDVVFTGDGTKTLLVHMKAGTSALSQIWLLDNTAPATRHSVSVTWDSDGVPTLASIAGSGTRFEPLKLVDGWWLIAITAENVVAANTNQFRIYPADAIPLGSVFIYGANAWDAEYPSSYQGPSLGSRSADQRDIPIATPPKTQHNWSLYVRISSPWTEPTTVVDDEVFLLLSDEAGNFSGADRIDLFRQNVAAEYNTRWTSPLEGTVTPSFTPAFGVFDLTVRHRNRDHSLRLDIDAAEGSWGATPDTHGDSAKDHDTVRLAGVGSYCVELLLISRTHPSRADLAIRSRFPYVTWNDGAEGFLASGVPRLEGWNPDRASIDDRAFALADGGAFRTVFRTDYLATFALPNLRASELTMALRLKDHLVGGGTVVVVTQDKDNNVYSAKVAPGTEPDLEFTDPVNVEYALRLALRNNAASPMLVRY